MELAHEKRDGRYHPALHGGRRAHQNVLSGAVRVCVPDYRFDCFVSCVHGCDELAAFDHRTCHVPNHHFIFALFHNKIRERFTDCDEAEGVLSTIAQENLTGVRVVRAFGREEFERERFEAQNQEYTNLWVKLCYTLSQFWAVGDVTSCLQVMLVVVFGSILCVNGDMTKGEFISFAFYNAMLITPVRRLGRMISEMSKAGVSVDRLAEVLNAPVEEDAPGAKIAPMDKDISFAHVSFSYETGPEILHDELHDPSGRELRNL